MVRLRWVMGLILAVLLEAQAAPGAEPSYHRDVVPILQRHCQECHRPGQVAPFALLSFEQVRKRASDIVTLTEDRRMPPWHASTTVGGPFKDARVMTEEEIATLTAWVAAGCPEGNPTGGPCPSGVHLRLAPG